MFLKAGALSLALLVASRLLGLLRESAQAAAFGASGLGDVAVLMLSLPDWLAGVLASGALAYVLLPIWAQQTPAVVALMQRRLAQALLAAGLLLGLALMWQRHALTPYLAAGLPTALQPLAARSLLWSAAALPLALLAALWSTRLQHEQRFASTYMANLVVNGALVAALIAAASMFLPERALDVLGLGLIAAMLLRLGWLARQLPRSSMRHAAPLTDAVPAAVRPDALAWPACSVWLWAAAASGLPLTLPFVARSLASAQGPGALATFNYAWKLIELPLLLAIQLVATLALPAIARAMAHPQPADAAASPIRQAFALTFALACAAVAGLWIGAPAAAQLLFGWGRMESHALAQVSAWGRIGAWSLLPQALMAVALAVLAAQRRMRWGVAGYALALAGLLIAGAVGVRAGDALMITLNGLLWLPASVALAASRRGLSPCWPWSAWAAAGGGLLFVVVAGWVGPLPASVPAQLALAVVAAVLPLALAGVCSKDMRLALRY